MSKNKEMHSPLLLLLPFLLVAVILQIASLPPFIEENRPDFAAIVMIFFATIVGSNICLVDRICYRPSDWRSSWYKCSYSMRSGIPDFISIFCFFKI